MRSEFKVVLFFAALILAAYSPRAFGQGPPQRSAYASTCGSEIAWIDSFDDALAEAKKSQKPILWFVPKTQNSHMDRLQELYWYMMGGMFADAEVVAFVNAHFVPLRAGASGWMPREKGAKVAPKLPADALKKYGLVNLQFIEPGFLLLDKDGNLVHTMDRLTTFQTKWVMSRFREIMKAHPELGQIKADYAKPKASDAITAARALLATGKLAEAKTAYQAIVATGGADATEALYFAGVCAHMTQKTTEGDNLWKKAAATANRWGAKAKLELDRWGPFIHGFEEYRDYPERAFDAKILRGTTLPSTTAEIPEMTKRAVTLLLSMQREDGSWDDSRYDFGGLDSMPNVHTAVTSIVAWSLLEWREIDPQAIDAAVLKAFEYVKNERHTAPEDKDELIWAHDYRLLFLQRLSEAMPEKKDDAKKKMQDIVKRIEGFQQKSGDYRHEYPNPFASSSTLHALAVAQEAGLTIDMQKMKTAGEAIARCRGEDGTFSYGATKGQAENSPAPFAGGRSPLCELSLLLCKMSTPEKLGQSLKMAFDNHHYLEAIRKYDDHADQYHNGGFFFWYDMLGISESLKRYAGPEAKEWKTALRDQVLQIHEVDGAWIDSHELGKSYGTAMGLIVLKQNLAPKN